MKPPLLSLTVLAVLAAVGIDLCGEHVEEARRQVEWNKSFGSMIGPQERAVALRTQTTPTGSVYVYYSVMVDPRQSEGDQVTDVPPCSEPRQSESKVALFRYIGVGIAGLAHGAGDVGEVITSILEAAAKADAPVFARSLSKQTVASCAPLRFLVPVELKGRQLVDFHVYARRLGSPAQECVPSRRQRECRELQMVWTFPLDLLQAFGHHFEPKDEFGPLAYTLPTLVNWSAERREGVLVLEFK
jgi:hypothetical protein